MHKQVKWDSKREYEEFWNPGLKYRSPQKRNKHWIRRILFLFVLIFLVAGLVGIRHIGSKKQILESQSFADSRPSVIPDYSGQDMVYLNDNRPNFTENDYSMIEGEYYSHLDILGRCGTAVALLDQSMMPTEEREGIGKIKPSGWKQAKYPGIVHSEPPYLYNRCHLIAYALTGQNANELNLITGTRYMNVETMLPWERKVMQYLNNSENHVLYRVSPYFKDKELVARGVEMEAYSIEDHGDGVCFHVFVYNCQPGIKINYSNGDSQEM